MSQMEDNKCEIGGGGEGSYIISSGETLLTRLKPYLFVVFTGLCFAGFNIISKVSLDQGTSPYELVAYGYAFGTITTAILSLLFERKNESKINFAVGINIFCLGFLGAMSRSMTYAGMKYTSPAFVAAMSNLNPSITFVLAVLCRMERLDITKLNSQAKVGGTLIAFGGAALMTLYKGAAVISLRHTSHQISSSSSPKLFLDGDLIKGSLLIMAQNVLVSVLLMLQAATIKKYPAPITLTTLASLSGTLISTITAVIVDHRASSWRLSWDISLAAPLYTGIMNVGIVGYIHILVIRQKGPVFVTASRPLATVFTAIMGLLILGNSLHLGEIVGGTMTIFGLYALLWGKEREKKEELLARTALQQDVENKVQESKI